MNLLNYEDNKAKTIDLGRRGYNFAREKTVEGYDAAIKMTHIGTKKINDRIGSYIKLKEKKLDEIESAYKNINQEMTGITSSGRKYDTIKVKTSDTDKEDFRILQPDDEEVKNRDEDVVDFDRYYDKDIAKIQKLKNSLKSLEGLKIPKIESFTEMAETRHNKDLEELKELREMKRQVDKDLGKYQAEATAKAKKEALEGKNSWMAVKEYLKKNLKINQTSALGKQLTNVESNEDLMEFENTKLSDRNRYSDLPTWMVNSTTAGICNPGESPTVVFKCEKNGYWGFVNGYYENIQYYENIKVGETKNMNDTIQISVDGTDTPIFIFKVADNQEKTQCEEPKPGAEGGKKKRKTNKKRKTLRRKRRSKKHL